MTDVAIGQVETESKHGGASGKPDSMPRDGDPIISRAVLAELAELQLGQRFVGLFVEECLRDSLKAIGELERSGLAARWDVFRDQCHALKGVAGNMGADRLAAAASDAMRLGSWQLAGEWQPRVQQLREQLAMARSALRATTIAAQAGNEPDRSP